MKTAGVFPVLFGSFYLGHDSAKRLVSLHSEMGTYKWNQTVKETELRKGTEIMNDENNKLHFKLVNHRNRSKIESLEIYPEQAGLIETPSECMQEADEFSQWRPVGIYSGDLLIGFAMYGYFSEPSPGKLWLDRLLIDKRYQGKGYGKQVVAALLDRLHTEYSTEKVYLSVYENNTNAIRLYQQIGFCFNGQYDTKGEHIMEYHFS